MNFTNDGRRFITIELEVFPPLSALGNLVAVKQVLSKQVTLKSVLKARPGLTLRYVRYGDFLI